MFLILFFNHLMYSIEINNLVVNGYDWRFNVSPILKNLNLKVEKNQIFGFLWLNWAGKTTTINTILWNIKKKNWEIKLFWNKIDKNTIKRIWYSPDEAIFYDHLTWIEHLNFFGKLWSTNKETIKERSENLLKKLWLEFAKNRKVSKYSKWMKQRLAVAISLINEPELLLWDEPMSGLDPLGRKLIKDLMLDLKNQWKTIFFSTHILSDVQELADEFAIIHEWKILVTEKVKNLKNNLEDFFISQIQKSNEIF